MFKPLVQQSEGKDYQVTVAVGIQSVTKTATRTTPMETSMEQVNVKANKDRMMRILQALRKDDQVEITGSMNRTTIGLKDGGTRAFEVLVPYTVTVTS